LFSKLKLTNANLKIMKYTFLIFVYLLTALSSGTASAQIIADHSVVDDFDKIPQQYIDDVKKMWVILAGESHSKAYRIGCQLLENSNPKFQVNIKDSGIPEGFTDQYLRLSRGTWGDVNTNSGWIYSYGEEDWFTSSLAIGRTKDHLTHCNTNNMEIAAMGFGWCWDMTANNWPGGEVDPVYQVRWAGRTDGGPEGSMRWGLDGDDQSLTGNSICMDTYLNATIDYMNHCQTNDFPTRMFFTTGPVDGNSNLSENGYQRSIKHQYIKDFVLASPDRILFDYADILCWSDAGEEKRLSWKDFAGNTQTFPVIHDDNLLDLDGGYTEDGDHIGQRGALRLGKAMWWMLARMAGWDGNTLGMSQPAVDPKFSIQPNPVSDIMVINIDQENISGWLSVSDLNGKELLNRELTEPLTSVDLSLLDSGMYIVRLMQDDQIALRKVVKL
jgi:hypothetical protein